MTHVLEKTHLAGMTRLLISAGAGVAAGAGMALTGLDRAWFQDSAPVVALSAGWSAGALVFLLLSLTHLWPYSGEQTRDWSMREDPSKGWSRGLVLLAAAAALAAVGGLMVRSHDAPGSALPMAVLSIVAVFSAWFVIHTVYTLRYAEEFYAELAGRGGSSVHDDAPAASGVPSPIDFQGAGLPAYSDFAYFAFNLGLTYQVSDNTVASSALRKVILVHCLLSYIYSTAIMATIINLVVGLIQ